MMKKKNKRHIQCTLIASMLLLIRFIQLESNFISAFDDRCVINFSWWRLFPILSNHLTQWMTDAIIISGQFPMRTNYNSQCNSCFFVIDNGNSWNGRTVSEQGNGTCPSQTSGITNDFHWSRQFFEHFWKIIDLPWVLDPNDGMDYLRPGLS